MCLFSWEGEKCLLQIYPKCQLQRAIDAFKLSLPAILAWIPKHSTGPILQLQCLAPYSYRQSLGSVFVKKWTEIIIFCVMRPAKDIPHPLFVSVLAGLFLFYCLWSLSAACQEGAWTGLCNLLAKGPFAWELTIPVFEMWHCWGTEAPNQRSKDHHISAFQLRWWLHSE